MEKYLAFDCSGKEIIVAAFNGKKYLEKSKECSGTEFLMVLINEVLDKLKMDISEVEVLACSVGPGSWTGARVGVVTGYGLYCANKNLKLVKFNSFDLISYNDSDENIYIVQAYANFVYAKSLFGEMQCVTKEELERMAAGKKLVSRGDFLKGAKPCKRLKIRQVVEDKISKGEFCKIEDIEPVYLRLSQAEYQFMEKQEKLKKGKN